MHRILFVVVLLLSSSTALAQGRDALWYPGTPTHQDGGPNRGSRSAPSYHWPGGQVCLPFGVGVTEETILAAAYQSGAIGFGIELMEARGYIRRTDRDTVLTNTTRDLYVGIGFEIPGVSIGDRQPYLIYAQTEAGEPGATWEIGQLTGCVYQYLGGTEIAVSEAFVVEGTLTHSPEGMATGPPMLDEYGSTGYEPSSGPSEYEFALMQLQADLNAWAPVVAVGAVTGAAAVVATIGPAVFTQAGAARVGVGAIAGAYAAHVGFWVKRAAIGNAPAPGPMNATTTTTPATWGSVKARYAR
jgi:hypothetical protein